MDLDRFEGINAAEWDDVPESQSSAEQQEITPAMRLESGKIEDEKVNEILKARGMAPACVANALVPTLPNRSRALAKKPFKPVKTATCWFWATPSKQCRFTAEECRNLHAFLPTRLGEPTNLHTSKPVWPLHINTLEDWAPGKLIKVVNVAKNREICPTEPAFRALLAMQPDSDLSKFDIVGCGSTLGNLLRFCERIDKDFRFDIDRVRDTVFFIRKESSPTALIPDICGYGHAFPEAHTMWEPEVKGSASHQRIIQYDFGGLKFLVRSESDGYLKQAADLDAQPNDAQTANTSMAPLESKESLAKAQEESEADNYALLEALRVTGGASSTVGPLHIEMRGRRIPQKALFDLKTRAKETRRPIDMDEVFRRLWVNQTPSFMFAEHFRGFFEPRDIQSVSISDGISKWEKDQEALLKHYQAIVMEIIAATRNSATGKLQVIRRGSGPLEIQERVADADVLPHDLRSKW